MVAGPSKDPGPKGKKLNFKINTSYRILAAINVYCSIIDQQNNERQAQRRQYD